MGMVAKFYQASEGQLSQFLRHPSLAYDYTMSSLYNNPLAIEEAEDMLNKMSSQIARFSPSALRQVDNVAALLRRKTAARKGPRLVTPASEPESERKEFSLEKDWHVLHYSLNGTHDGGNRPLAEAILGGQEIPDIEGVTSFGAGSTKPLRYLTVEEVHNISDALQKVDPAQLLSRIDYEDAQQKRIYLSHTLNNLRDWEYLPELFINFRNFYADASRNNKAMLLSIV